MTKNSIRILVLAGMTAALPCAAAPHGAPAPAHAAAPANAAPAASGNAAPAATAKDIFASKSWYVPPPEPKHGGAHGRSPAAKPAPPPLPFTFLGKMLSHEGPNVYILSANDKVYTVREGDVLDGTYRVDKAQGGQLTMTYLPLKAQQSLGIESAS